MKEIKYTKKDVSILMVNKINKYSEQYKIKSSKVKKITQSDIIEILSVLDDVIFDIISSAKKTKSVNISSFTGIGINANYEEEKTKLNNFTGEKQIVQARIKPKIKFTRSFCDKLIK